MKKPQVSSDPAALFAENENIRCVDAITEWGRYRSKMG